MKIVLLGAPGSGKGTQAKLLAERYQVPHISTGDLLRVEVAAASLLGRQAKTAMDAGQLVSDDVVLGMIEQRLAEPDAKKGFILDGFPRNLSQAEALDALLERLDQSLEAALLIDVDSDILMQRLTGRRTCVSCGQMYNVYSSPSKLEDRCDKCGGNLRHRADDNEETIGSRLRVYEAQIVPLIAYYRDQSKLYTVQGVGEIADIYRAVTAIADELPSAKEFRRESSEMLKLVTIPPSGGKAAGMEAGKVTLKPVAAKVRGKRASSKTSPKATNLKQLITKQATPKKSAPKQATSKEATKMAAPKRAAPKQTAPTKTTAKKTAPTKASPAKKASSKS